MPITTYTRDEIAAQVLAFFRVRFPGRDLGPESWLGKQARAVAMALLQIQAGIEDADHDGTPGPLTSSLQLDAFAVLFGLPSNLGGYGRNGAVAATGAAGPASGTKGITFSDGLLLTASDSVTTFKLLGAVTIPGTPPGSDSATAQFVAVTAGIAGNLPIGSDLRWQSPPAGAEPTVTLSSPSGGGLDVETDEVLLQRIFDRLQQPPKGGANIDYITWAKSIPGVSRVCLYPRRQGTLTVDLVPLSAGSGTGRVPSNATLEAVADYIRSVMPTDVEELNVLAASTDDDRALTILTRIKLLSGYKWDWDDTGGTWTVAGYSAGTPSLTLNTAADATLTAAVDLGLKPLIQVAVTGRVLPAQARVLSYDVTKTILTLEAALADAPTNGDGVRAGSYVVPIIAQDILDYIDGLGTARGVYADEVNVWEDTVAIFGIGAVVTDAVDSDGRTRMVERVLVGGITIAIGSGGPAATDFTPVDLGTEAIGPELARAAQIVVTQ